MNTYQRKMAAYLSRPVSFVVVARILGNESPAEQVAGPFPKRSQATSFAQYQQRQIPDPVDGDVVFFVRKVSS